MPELTKAQVTDLAARIEDALNDVLKEDGLTATINGGRFDPTVGTFEPKLTISARGAERREFELSIDLFDGFTADDWQAEFTTREGTYRLDRCYPQRPKWAFGATKVDDGQRYKFTEDQVLRALGRPVIRPLG